MNLHKGTQQMNPDSETPESRLTDDTRGSGLESGGPVWAPLSVRPLCLHLLDGDHNPELTFLTGMWVGWKSRIHVTSGLEKLKSINSSHSHYRDLLSARL